MTEITLNGEVYVKKNEIEVDHEMAVLYFKNLDDYKFIQLVDEIVLEMLKDRYDDLSNLMEGHSNSNTNRTLLKIHYATHDY